MVGPRGIAVVLLALLAYEPPTLVPRLDEQVVGRPADPCQNHLGYINLEAMRRLILIGGGSDLDCAAGDLGIAEPSARVVLWRVLGCSVKGEPRIAPEVLSLHRSRHHPH